MDGLLREAGLASFDVGGRRSIVARHRLRAVDEFWEQLDRVMRRLDGAPRRDRRFQDFLDTRPKTLRARLKEISADLPNEP